MSDTRPDTDGTGELTRYHGLVPNVIPGTIRSDIELIQNGGIRPQKWGKTAFIPERVGVINTDSPTFL